MGAGSAGWRRLVGAALVALLLGAGTMPAVALAAGGSGGSKSSSKSGGATATAASKASPTATAATTVTAPPPNNPLSGGVTPIGPSATPTVTSSTPTIVSGTATSGSSSLSGGSAIGIAVGAFLVIGGISFFIWRDSRRRAPKPVRAVAADAPRIPGSKRPPKARKLSPAERRRRKRGRSR